MLVVTVCIYLFAVIGAERQQIEAVATQLPDPRRETDRPLGAAPIAMTLARAERHSITETVPVTGSLVAREEIVVGAEVDGLRIVEILADVGDRVEQGQVLARLDGNMLRIQLAQNTSTIAKAEASIGQVRASIAETQAAEAEAADALKRTQTLGATGATSPVQLLARETQAKVAAARATAAEENLRIAKAEEALHQQHVAGRGNRQKFRDALDDAENHRPYCIRHHDVVHFCCKSRVLLAYSHRARNRKKTPKHRLPRASAGL